MHIRTPEVVVIGAGILGLTTAWYLSRAGMTVSVYERDDRPRQASWAGAGILSPLLPWQYPDAVQRLALASQQIYPSLVDEVCDLADIEVECRKLGMLILDADQVEAGVAWSQAHSLSALELSSAEAAKRFPGIAQCGPALWLPDVHGLRNPHWLRALIAALRRVGVNIYFNTPVSELLRTSRGVAGVRTAQGDSAAGAVVIAGGAWSAELAAPWITLPMRPVKGQMLLYDGGRQAPVTILQRNGRYLIPRADGKVLCGSTAEESGFDAKTTDAAARELAESVTTMWPALAGHKPLRQWAGLRPALSDNNPCIGGVTGVDGLYLNTGHFRHGVTSAPASAQILVERLAGKSDGRADINPDRFLKKGI